MHVAFPTGENHYGFTPIVRQAQPAEKIATPMYQAGVHHEDSPTHATQTFTPVLYNLETALHFSRSMAVAAANNHAHMTGSTPSLHEEDQVVPQKKTHA